MGKGNRNKRVRGVDQVELPQRNNGKKKKQMPKWLVSTISIAVAVIIVLGIVAAVMFSNGSFRRMQVLIKSKTGEFDINRQVATFLAWEIEYYSAYIDYYTSGDEDLQKQYSSAEAFAHEYALARVTQEITNAETGAIISTPRDAIDNTLQNMINFVAVCDYAYEQGIRLEEGEWKKDFTITWYSGMQDTLPISWNDLEDMMVVDKTYGLSYSNLDLFLDDYFGTGMNSDDVEDALKLICMYEKYLAMNQEQIEGTVSADPEKDPKIQEYIKNNPQYFYTVEYLSYETEDVALKDALKAATSPEKFKTLIAEDWFDKQGNYKDTYNAFVSLKKAEAALEKIEKLVDSDEKTAWTDALKELAAVKKTYDVADKDKLHKDMSKWLFAKRSKYDEELVKADDKFYVLAMVEQTFDEDGDVKTATVYELTYDYVDGVSHEGDDNFKEAIKQHLLARKDLIEKAPETSYKNALGNADAYKEDWKALEKTAILEKMSSIGDRYKKTGVTANTSDFKKYIVEAVFDGDKKPVAGTLMTVEDTDTSAYIVYIDAVNTKTEGDKESYSVDLYYVEVEAHVFYEILVELEEELEKVLPASSDAYYTKNPNEKTYQHWMFNGANADNGFKSPIAANATEVFTKKVASTNGTGDDTEKHTVYMAVEPLHLDTTKLVDGGYYPSINSDPAEDLAKLDGKTGDALIEALQKLSPNSTNTATVSETLSEEGIDEELAAWLFSADRKANDKAMVEGKDGKTYIAVYRDSAETWAVMGKAYYVSDQLSVWLSGLASQYEASEWVLDRIGDPAPETEEHDH